MRLINYKAEPKLQDQVYKVEDYRLLTHVVAQIFLSPLTLPLSYEAGQYIKIIFPDQYASPFSLANAPLASQQLELHLLHLKDNYRATEIFRMVRDEGRLLLRGPFGSCSVNRLAAKRPLIFIARGTGFAPVKAVIEALLARPEHPPMHLYWSAPTWPDLYLHDLINRWVKEISDFRFTAVLTREPSPSGYEAKFGKVSNLVLEDYPDLSKHQVYASGPESMIYESLAEFQQQGLPREWFFSDVFDYQP